MPHRFNETGSPQPDDSADHSFHRHPRSDLNDPLQIGISIVGVTAVFGGIGWWLDTKLHTFPILMAIGAFLGLFGIIYLTYLRLQEHSKQAADQSKDNRPPFGDHS
ncbi:MAG: AtpZ/AtpI family protein [Calditrichota bacterium]